jgi:hypothetical protein
MSTQRQREANQANAQKSTGPVTPEGKAASSRSRLSHGFFSKTQFLSDEAPEEFWSLLADFMTEHQPATPTEQILIEKMAQSQWTSLRASNFQMFFLNNVGTIGADGVQRGVNLFLRYQITAGRAFSALSTSS